jgi:hypothetical protein
MQNFCCIGEKSDYDERVTRKQLMIAELEYIANAQLTKEEKTFFMLADSASPIADKLLAKEYGKENFAKFSENTKNLFRHIFPEVSQKAFPVKPEPRYVTAGFAASEESYW